MSKTYDTIIIISLLFLVSLLTFRTTVSILSDSNGNGNITDVSISDTVFNDISEMFRTSKNEFVVCLYGTMQGNNAVITQYRTPDIVSLSDRDRIRILSVCPNYADSSDTSVMSEAQRKVIDKMLDRQKDAILGVAHNHINRVCEQSISDAYSFGYSRYAFSGVICGENTVKIYTRNDLANGFNAERLR